MIETADFSELYLEKMTFMEQIVEESACCPPTKNIFPNESFDASAVGRQEKSKSTLRWGETGHHRSRLLTSTKSISANLTSRA
jgi:hypothetical protein